MKFYAAVALTLSISPSLAFAPRLALKVSASVTNSDVSLFARPDSSAAVARALETSKKFGPTSKEAAAAWDIVEEMDASDNRWVRVWRCIAVWFLLLSTNLNYADDASDSAHLLGTAKLACMF